MEVLRRLCLGEARFKELNETITNTRTLSRRLRDLAAEGLVQKAGTQYRITREGFETTLKIVELEGKTESKGINPEELDKVRYGWMKISLGRLTELFLKEFGDELISLVLYGSAVKGSFQLCRSDIDLLYILEDDSRDVWPREESVFKAFQSTWEYRACEYWLKTQGFYGYPEVTTASLQKSYAKTFQPIYLDMLSHRAVLYDKEEFFHKLMMKLEEVLKALGTIRIEHPDGTYGWLLKPDMAPGELIEIGLG
ncbi:winged helix-turn-helix transcriptional regulator [Candidatus Bathyarchaeota archaeon]|nr:winged helix-turn-helix transcriptional regulator [Candidatus Bathyarchaeota archaeon]